MTRAQGVKGSAGQCSCHEKHPPHFRPCSLAAAQSYTYTRVCAHSCIHTHTLPHTAPTACTDLSHVAPFQNVTEKQKACETDLAKAEPALLAAQEALDTLNKVQDEGRRLVCVQVAAGSGQPPGVVQGPTGPFQMLPVCCSQNNLTELKSFGSPPDAVVNVTAAVMILTAPGGKIPKDKSWKAAKIMMGKVDTFLDSLKKFDKEHIPEACLKAFK